MDGRRSTEIVSKGKKKGGVVIEVRVAVVDVGVELIKIEGTAEGEGRIISESALCD